MEILNNNITYKDVCFDFNLKYSEALEKFKENIESINEKYNCIILKPDDFFGWDCYIVLYFCKHGKLDYIAMQHASRFTDQRVDEWEWGIHTLNQLLERYSKHSIGANRQYAHLWGLALLGNNIIDVEYLDKDYRWSVRIYEFNANRQWTYKQLYNVKCREEILIRLSELFKQDYVDHVREREFLSTWEFDERLIRLLIRWLLGYQDNMRFNGLELAHIMDKEKCTYYSALFRMDYAMRHPEYLERYKRMPALLFVYN